MSPAQSTPARGSGHCLCGAVTYAWQAKPRWSGHCHCASCRRNCAAPMTSFFGVKDGAWAWTGRAPKLYESNPGVRRYFCDRCGTPMAYAADRFPGETHFYAATMDDPGQYSAQFHVHYAARLEWLELADELPRHEGISQ